MEYQGYFICLISLLKILLEIEGCTGPGGISTSSTPEKDWWQVSQFYQIYPRSFKDSNGDGIGDLKGIISKLSYLKEIGVNATWLSPIYVSPMADFGYDIANFFDIQPEYGSLEDFDELIKEANKLGLKIIMDFVPNHSSDENVWFQKSVNREKGYEDYYVWHDGYVDENGQRQPPSNWLQAFRGSAWEWNEKRQQYYLHQFAVKQPDLNYRNPDVVAQMKRVLTYWLDRGVAGFRVDAVPWMFEVLPNATTGLYPDEPLSGLYPDDPLNFDYLSHIYTQDQPETIDMVYQWRQLLDDYQRIHGGETRVLMIETWSNINEVMKLYGNRTRQGAQIPFNFQFIAGGHADLDNTDLGADGFVNIIGKWMDNMPAGKTANWVMGNHDRSRVGTRYGDKRIDLMNMLQMFLPGASVTYMGEEIGMIDTPLSWEESVDPAACNADPETYDQFSRDPERTPFQWSTEANAGFSTNESTWLPVNPYYLVTNVETERAKPKSHLNVYKQMSELRQTRTLQYGSLKYGNVGENILAIKRSLPGEKTYILLANVSGHAKTVDVTDVIKASGKFKVKIVNIISNRKEGYEISLDNVYLSGNEAIIVESI
ncbi:maltase A3-like [Musca domestica]|uniref:alpha-glucosidase n=1 Tax=Musca domestica TaxID=7370 RepID=A0A1I8N8F6_MUSDO|nr:maltase A3-like [Musca domestica]